jgi:microcystin-dependent protein
MKRWLFVAAWTMLLAIFSAAPRLAVAQATEPFIGQVMTVGFNFCPKGWAKMNGQLMPIAQNQALFSLLGIAYGGDGQSTFALPTGKPVFTATGAPLLQCMALQGVYPAQN